MMFSATNANGVMREAEKSIAADRLDPPGKRAPALEVRTRAGTAGARAGEPAYTGNLRIAKQ
jgi:hypothetical protein